MIVWRQRIFLLRAKRSDALHSRWTNLAAGVVGFFGCFPHQELIGDIGWFHHEYNIRTYVENNTTCQEHLTRTFALAKFNRTVTNRWQCSLAGSAIIGNLVKCRDLRTMVWHRDDCSTSPTCRLTDQRHRHISGTTKQLHSPSLQSAMVQSQLYIA